MQEIVVIDGEITLENVLDGEVELEAITDLDPDVVMSAGGGITPSGTIEITENGVYDVTEYASADVDVQGGVTPTGTKQISITANGVTTEDVTNYADVEVTTAVPASAVDTGTKSISTNGTHDVVGYASASVAVPASAVDSGTKSITSNGTHDVIGYASASVAVPNSYSASDEGKVVSNGALVAQTSDTVTANNTYDTTLINSLTVNVSGGGGITADGLAMNTEPNGAVVLSTATKVNDSGFRFRPITSIIGNSVTTIGANAFQNCPLTSIEFPNLTSLGVGAFESNTSLVKLNLPSMTNWGNAAIKSCSNLKYIIIPSYTGGTVPSGFYSGVSKLEIVDYGKGSVGFWGLPSCPLATIILRKTTAVQPLGSATELNNTAFKSGGTGGTIYIPEELYNHLGDGTSLDYKNATNWSVYEGYGTITWVKLEGSQYESIYWGNSI